MHIFPPVCLILIYRARVVNPMTNEGIEKNEMTLDFRKPKGFVEEMAKQCVLEDLVLVNAL